MFTYVEKVRDNGRKKPCVKKEFWVKFDRNLFHTNKIFNFETHLIFTPLGVRVWIKFQIKEGNLRESKQRGAHKKLSDEENLDISDMYHRGLQKASLCDLNKEKSWKTLTFLWRPVNDFFSPTFYVILSIFINSF